MIIVIMGRRKQNLELFKHFFLKIDQKLLSMERNGNVTPTQDKISVN
jgi:hypothetical protein